MNDVTVINRAVRGVGGGEAYHRRVGLLAKCFLQTVLSRAISCGHARSRDRMSSPHQSPRRQISKEWEAASWSAFSAGNDRAGVRLNAEQTSLSSSYNLFFFWDTLKLPVVKVRFCFFFFPTDTPFPPHQTQPDTVDKFNKLCKFHYQGSWLAFCSSPQTVCSYALVVTVAIDVTKSRQNNRNNKQLIAIITLSQNRVYAP